MTDGSSFTYAAIQRERVAPAPLTFYRAKKLHDEILAVTEAAHDVLRHAGNVDIDAEVEVHLQGAVAELGRASGVIERYKLVMGG